MERNDLDDLSRDLKDGKKSNTSYISGRSAAIGTIPKVKKQNKTAQNTRNSNTATSKKSATPITKKAIAAEKNQGSKFKGGGKTSNRKAGDSSGNVKTKSAVKSDQQPAEKSNDSLMKYLLSL